MKTFQINSNLSQSCGAGSRAPDSKQITQPEQLIEVFDKYETPNEMHPHRAVHIKFRF